MWNVEDLGKKQVAPAIAEGSFVLALLDGQPAGTLRFQLSDPDFWPEVTGDDCAFVHRFAVRRRFAGMGVSTALIQWSAEQARALRRHHLRLDCDAARPKLRAFYEAHGFVYHSTIQWKSFLAARYEMHLELEG